ncbi:reverse transcriptase domain-containing protein [Tanacetum coccineum]
MRELWAIPSTTHAMMKFPTPRGISTLVPRTATIFECRQLEVKQILPEELPKEGMAEEDKNAVEEIMVNPAFLDQKVIIRTQFSLAYRKQLINMLRDNQDVFAWQPSDMAWVPRRIIQHSLNVNVSITPVAQKRRILGSEKSKAVTREIEEWIKAGIVRPVRYSTWISNPVLVKKVDDTWRMCIDFKNVNSACPKDYYPLPEIDLKIEAVMGFPFKCFLDAYKGYHQIQMAKEDEEKTAFYTDQGTYCYTKMPFGLKNAGATYQSLIDSAFQAQLGRNLEAYVDDMVIKSKTEQEMIMDIAKTFDNLRKVNMKLNLKKLNPKKFPFKCFLDAYKGYHQIQMAKED